jgi:hypothetical protein
MRFYYGAPPKFERAECIKSAYKTSSYKPIYTVRRNLFARRKRLNGKNNLYKPTLMFVEYIWASPAESFTR